jgi:hypothetical protein
MPADPDPSFDGYSIGRWIDGTLEVETAAILPQVFLMVLSGNLFTAGSSDDRAWSGT